MNNVFKDDEKLYRAVLPASMYWKKSGGISSAAFSDNEGLSVERGNHREEESVVKKMRRYFRGSIVSVTAKQCKDVNAVLKYKPTMRSRYHSEIHGSEDSPLLKKSQRKQLASVAKIVYQE